MLKTERRAFDFYGKKMISISIRSTRNWKESDERITRKVKKIIKKFPQALIRLENHPIDKERIDESIDEALKILRADKQKPSWMD